jgi:hypothetical protein
MKKIALAVILLLFAVLAWNLYCGAGDMSVNIDGERIDGPLGAVLGLLLGGAGLIIGTVVMVMVGAVLAVVFAGVGILVVSALALAALIVAVVVSPLLLLFLPLAVIWFLVSRARRNRLKAEPV